MTLAAIWAQDRFRVIGSGTGMLWRVPADLAFFKKTTLGASLIMGRSSWEALGTALPGRKNIVITRTAGYVAPGALVVSSIPEALEVAGQNVWIAGGAQIYAQTIGLVEKLVISELDFVAGDGVKAPKVDPEIWQLDEENSDHTWRPKSGDARWRVRIYHKNQGSIKP
jgi:Dihydrofolate reductase